VLKLFP